MSGGRLVFPGPQGIVARRDDGRLVLLPARAAAGSRGRRGRSRLLPELPGVAVAVGFEGRWVLVRSRFEGEELLLRIPPRSDDYERRSLGEASEGDGDELTAIPDAGAEWPASDATAGGGRVLRLGGAEPLVTAEGPPGSWTVVSRRGEVHLEPSPELRVVAPALLERELGLAAVAGRELSFIGAEGSARRTILDLEPEEAAPCAGAPWLALREGDAVSLRQLGSRWARRLGRWSLADC